MADQIIILFNAKNEKPGEKSPDFFLYICEKTLYVHNQNFQRPQQGGQGREKASAWV